MIAMPCSPLTMCRFSPFQVRIPATRVASGRWAAMSRTFEGDYGQSHRLRDSRSLHCASGVVTGVAAADGEGRDVGRTGALEDGRPPQSCI